MRLLDCRRGFFPVPTGVLARVFGAWRLDKNLLAPDGLEVRLRSF